MGQAVLKNATASEEDVIEVSGMTFTKTEIESGAYLDDRCDEISETLAEGEYFTRYFRDNYCRSLEENADIASDIFSAGSWAEGREKALESLSEQGACTELHYEDEILPSVRKFLREITEEAKDLGWEVDEDLIDEREHELANQVQECVLKKDDSSPEDLLWSGDRAEAAFVFRRKDGLHLEDCSVYSHKAWADWEHMSITPSWMETLSRLGYTLGEYRKHSRNKHEQYEQGQVYRARRKREVPLVTLEELQELVENACSNYFHIGIYAQIPIAQLLNTNLDKPVVLSSYSVCSFSSSGTFYEITKKEPIILRPEDGQWVAFGKKGPSDWCGLVNSYFHADISN